MARTPAVWAAALVLIATVAMPAAALPPPMTLEDRVADSRLVVSGEIAKTADETPAGLGRGRVRCTVKVTRVFKGPADLKEVQVLCPKPPAPPQAPAGIQAVRIGGAFRKAEVGEKAIWMLVKHPSAEGCYREFFYHPVHEQDTAEAVAAVAKVAADPAKVLEDEKAADRQRLSAAYLLLRTAVPENRLPFKEPEVVEDGVVVRKGVRDTAGYERLDADLVNRAVETAIRGLANVENLEGKPHAWPGAHGLAMMALSKTGCPVNELRPEIRPAKQRSREQMLRDQAEHCRTWAEAARKWWDEHKDTVKLYVPKSGHKALRGGR